MSQVSLIEESQKALRARRRARAAAEAAITRTAKPAEPLVAGPSKSTVPCAAAPASSKTPLPVCSRVKENEPPELSFRDESRYWKMTIVGRCTICRYEGALQAVYRPLLGCRKYRMKCSNPRCANATDWFPNSQDAIQVWRLAAALVK